MSKTTTSIIILLLLAIPLAGCIENMRDLKDRFDSDDGLDPASVEKEPAKPVVAQPEPKKAPVARMSIYDGVGALAYKSSFIGEDPASIIPVKANETITLNGGDSETLEPGATLVSYTWALTRATLADPAGTPTGRQVLITAPATPGIITVVLTVKDSNNETDTQTVRLAVAPEPFTVVTQLRTAMIVGADVQGTPVGEPVSVPFDLVSVIDDMTVSVQALRVQVRPGMECDVVAELFGPDGVSLGIKDDGRADELSQTETFNFEMMPAGTYTVTLTPYQCAAQAGVPITVTATYLEEIEGLGHGGHAGH